MYQIELSDANTPGQSGPGSDDNEIGTSHNKAPPLLFSIIISRHVRRSYSSAVMHLGYSTALTNWAVRGLDIS